MTTRTIAEPCADARHGECTVIRHFEDHVLVQSHFPSTEEAQEHVGLQDRGDVRLVRCAEHSDCIVVELHHEDFQHWESHAPSSTHVSCRISDTTPTVQGHDGTTHKWTRMCRSCHDHFGHNGPDHTPSPDHCEGCAAVPTGA